MDHPVSDRADPERAELPARFRDLHLPDWLGFVLARLDLGPDTFQESLYSDVADNLGDSDTVDPGRSCARGARHPVPRHQQERRVVDEVKQVTTPAGDIVSRPAVQLDLHSRYRSMSRLTARPRGGAGIHRHVLRHCTLLLD